MVFPPEPITSRILSTGMEMLIIFGAKVEAGKILDKDYKGE